MQFALRAPLAFFCTTGGIFTGAYGTTHNFVMAHRSVSNGGRGAAFCSPLHTSLHLRQFQRHRSLSSPTSQAGARRPGRVFVSMSATQKIFFVLGNAGSGKGTQCAKLVDEFGLDHVSAGDLLRAEVQTKSERGAMIDAIIKEGHIVPGHITIELLKAAIEST